MRPSSTIEGWRDEDDVWSVFADLAVLEDGRTLEHVRLAVRGSLIESVEHGTRPTGRDLYLPGSVLTPGLSNGHDHLKYHWPQLVGGRVSSSYEWIPLLQEEAARTFFKWASATELYWLGTYANIFAGVTTVINHARLPPIVGLNQFGLRIPTDFRRELMIDEHRNDVVWEHRMGGGAVQESLDARANGEPFVVHAAEGVDDSSAGEVDHLARSGALHGGCVLVHAINVTSEEVALIADAGASVVWCPSSNFFLFGRTAPVRSYLDSGVNLLLGTDSPCSGSGSLRRELALASELLADALELETLEAWKIAFRMVAANFAAAFPNSSAGMRAGDAADFVLFRAGSGRMAGPLDLDRPPQVVVRSGRALLAPRVATANGYVPMTWLPTSSAETSRDEVVVIGSPAELLADIASASGVDMDFFPLARDLMDS